MIPFMVHLHIDRLWIGRYARSVLVVDLVPALPWSRQRVVGRCSRGRRAGARRGRRRRDPEQRVVVWKAAEIIGGGLEQQGGR